MRAIIYLLETGESNLPYCTVLVCEAEYKDLEHLREAARHAKSERYDYRPGILFACVSGCNVIAL